MRIGEEAGMRAEGLAGGKRCGILIYGTDGEDEGLGVQSLKGQRSVVGVKGLG